VLIAESSMKSKIRINDYNSFRKYNVRRVVFETSLLGRVIQLQQLRQSLVAALVAARKMLANHCQSSAGS
jgi:hypothetical protein